MEYAYVERAGGEGVNGFLALDPRIAIVRHEVLAAALPAALLTGDIKVVVALAEAEDLPELNLDEEMKVVNEALSGLEGIELQSCQHATLKELQPLLPGAGVFHFSGHGDFTRKIGARPAHIRALGLSRSRTSVLMPSKWGSTCGAMACVWPCSQAAIQDAETASACGVASRLHSSRQRIPAVVANQYTILDKCAIAFSHQFYQALAGGLPIERAVSAGRIAAYNADKGGRDWGVPVLYLRAAAGRLFAGAADPQVRERCKQAAEIDVNVRASVVKAGGVLFGADVHRMVDGKLAVAVKVAGTVLGEVTGFRGINVEGGTLHARVDVDVLETGGEVTGAKIDTLGGSSSRTPKAAKSKSRERAEPASPTSAVERGKERTAPPTMSASADSFDSPAASAAEPEVATAGFERLEVEENDSPQTTARFPDAAAQRWFNAELEDHAPDEPLKNGEWYTLAFDVDVVKRDSGVAAAPVDDRALFTGDTEEVQLTIQLDSDDFEVSEPTRILRLPRVGRSRGKARFDISPRHDGPSMLRATIHKEGNFIQQMDLTFSIGATTRKAVEVTTKGRPPSAAAALQPRDAGMTIQRAPAGGYDCLVWGAVASRARLTIQEAHLASAIDVLRTELIKVVMHESDGEHVFQTSIDIALTDRDVALRALARAGARLFQQIFFGPGAGADSKLVGELLRNLATDPGTRLKIQIVAENAPVPWGLLYLGEVAGNAQLDWYKFLGMRHVVESIPLMNTSEPPDESISSEPLLTVGINVNSEIDRQMESDFVARQQMFWQKAARDQKRIRVVPRTTRAQVLEALTDEKNREQILYFYCHAASAGLDDRKGPDAASLALTDGDITLGDLSLDAPTSMLLRGNPLVFINACESADLSPTFYDGFVPYFMAKGARGVVGTECKTPALFAAEWAQQFFDRFLAGEPLGEAFLALRQEFLEQHGNPLGLLYAVHCSGDTRIQPALASSV